jgi:glyoxylase-like metal-dependent hydrolase (beta-lactamase superfamily II)
MDLQFTELVPGVLWWPANYRHRAARSNVYVLLDGPGGRPAVIEPAHQEPHEADFLCSWIRDHQACIGVTHLHIDHTIGIDTLVNRTGAEVWGTVTGKTHPEHQRFDVAHPMKEGDMLGAWEVLSTPGHAHEHVVFRRGGVIVSGDVSKVGDGHPHEFLASVERVSRLDPETVLPGHGPPILHHSFGKWVRWRLRDVDADDWARLQ